MDFLKIEMSERYPYGRIGKIVSLVPLSAGGVSGMIFGISFVYYWHKLTHRSIDIKNLRMTKFIFTNILSGMVQCNHSKELCLKNRNGKDETYEHNKQNF